ncbi:MAG: hypothetical protein LBJ02_04125 [Bifidobacteriaceae bacterium]|nr:hypothetical protein [Bifidobacteriaceae bacterium]
MPRGSRRARRAVGPRRPLDLAQARGGQPSRVVVKDGREFFVSVPSAAAKDYVCPGCGASVARGQSQVTAWEAESLLGAASALELRRHWHLACWRAFTGR